MGAVHIPIIDEDALDDLVTAVQALAAPSGTNVAISNTGMHYVTASNAQGAISELDAEAYALNASLTNLYYYSDSTKLDTHSIDVSTVVSYNVTPTHNGWLAVTFSTGANNVECYARIRYGHIGDYFQGVFPAYYGNETFLMIPCQANKSYTVEVKRANTTGTLTLDTWELY